MQKIKQQDKPLERETRLVVNIPLYYKKEPDLRGANYYQIPISKEKVLELSLIHIFPNVLSESISCWWTTY